jgi:pilus assembly protein FimV
LAETCQRGRRFLHLPIFAPTALAAGLLLFAGPGHGLEFGRWQATAVIGSPLDFTLALQVPVGEISSAPHRGHAAPASQHLRGAVAGRPRNTDGLSLDRLLPAASGAAVAAAVGAAAVVAFAGPQRLPSVALQALQVPDSVALAVPAALADAATQTATDQIKFLELQVQQVLAEARRQQDQLAQLRQHLSAADSANVWLPWLLLGLCASGLLMAWLALRVRRLQRELEQRRWTADADGLQALLTADRAEAGGAPLWASDRPMRSMRHAATAAAAATAPDMTIAQPKMAAAAAPPLAAPSRPSTEFSLGTGVQPRPVSVEELLDLDQQVDFFLVLGQEQAAVELLLSHVRSTGGTNALPYFKLLEIYCQNGDDEAYERTRERFNQRFNGFAPAVDGDLMAGRSLEDYPEVVLRLQRAWSQPLRAVAELDSLLLRRADLEPFDLPAYSEILMLHALVRDLPAGALHAATAPKPALAPRPDPVLAALHSPADGQAYGGVDLLLPLGDGPLDITVPHSQVSERASAQAMLAEWVFTRSAQAQTAADDAMAACASPVIERSDSLPLVDLDLSDFAPAPREFTRPAAFTDIDQRRDSRLSDLGSLDEGDALPTVSRR